MGLGRGTFDSVNPALPSAPHLLYSALAMDEQDFRAKCDAALEALRRRLLQLGEGLAGLVQHECAGGLRPPQLEAGRERGNPDLARGAVRADDEPGFLGLLEKNLEFAGLSLHLEAVQVAQFQQAAAQRFEGRVALRAEIVFLHSQSRVQQYPYHLQPSTYS